MRTAETAMTGWKGGTISKAFVPGCEQVAEVDSKPVCARRANSSEVICNATSAVDVSTSCLRNEASSAAVAYITDTGSPDLPEHGRLHVPDLDAGVDVDRDPCGSRAQAERHVLTHQREGCADGHLPEPRGG